MTKRQKRANCRMERAKSRKVRNFNRFLMRVAQRRLENPGDNLLVRFCCIPESLGMPLDEFMSAGQKLVGGAAVLFHGGVLRELLPDWACSSIENPHLLTREYLAELYDADGNRRGYQPDSTSSGSWRDDRQR